jgi:hypothetical protein
VNALDLWFQCRARSISLSLNGDRLHYDGDPAAVEMMLPAMKANRDALRECVISCNGSLFEDGPFLPWGPYLNAGTLRQWQRDLFAVVAELAKLEGWRDDHYDIVVGAIERQPISTLRPDLHHFSERLDKARAAATTRSDHDE